MHNNNDQQPDFILLIPVTSPLPNVMRHHGSSVLTLSDISWAIDLHLHRKHIISNTFLDQFFLNYFSYHIKM